VAARKKPKLACSFYRTATGNEPVRDWLKSLPEAVRKEMVLLHGFQKKTQKTPKADVDLARQRLKDAED